MRILFVDDNGMILRTMQTNLKEYYMIDVATNYRQTHALLTKNNYDVIFLDYEMPDYNGEEVLKKIRAIASHKDTPIVFLTATAEKSQVIKLLHLKPAAYLVKPVTPEQIISTILKVTDHDTASTPNTPAESSDEPNDNIPDTPSDEPASDISDDPSDA